MCRNISLMVGYRIVILLDWEVYGNHMQLTTLCSPITSTTTTRYNFITYVFPPLARSTCNIEKSRYVTLPWGSINKPPSCKYGRKTTKKLTSMTFLCMIALRNKTVTHTILPPFGNVNGPLCQEGC